VKRHAKAASEGPIEGGRVALVLLIVALILLTLAPVAQAGKAVLGSFGQPEGQAAGRMREPTGLAVNRAGVGGAAAGDVYVADTANSRISEFSASGAFVRAFGYDVVGSGQHNSGANEQQTVTLKATKGTFSLALMTASGMGAVSSGSNTVTGVTAGIGAFRVGDAISGIFIPSNTTITAVGAGTLTLSQNATGNSTTASLTATESTGAAGIGTYASGSSEVTGVATTAGTFAVGQTLTSNAAGIPPDTTIVAVGAGTLTLSAPATASGSAKTLTATSIPYNASAAELKATLEGLPGVGAGNVGVAGGPGDATGSTPYAVTFSGGSLAHNDLAEMSANPAGLSEGAKTVAVATAVPGGGPEVCEATSSPTDVCKAGSAIALAGALRESSGIAIDQAIGNLYAVDNGNDRIDVFSAKGAFQGAFGWSVNATTPEAKLQFCTTVTGCRAGVTGFAAGQVNIDALTSEPAVDPGNGHVYVPESGIETGSRRSRVAEFAPALNGAKEVTGASFVRAFGNDVVPGGGTGLEVCTEMTGCKGGTSASTSAFFSRASLAVDSSGAIYVANVLTSGQCTQYAECSIQKYDAAVTSVEDFAPAELTPNGTANNITTTDVAVDPVNDHVFVAKKSGAQNYKILELDSSGELIDSSPALESGLNVGSTNSNGHGLAIGTAGRLFLAHIFTNGNASGIVHIFGPPPAPTATIKAVSAVGATIATFSGTVTPPPPGPEGEHFATSYHFEYSLDGLTWSRVPAEDIELGDGSGAGSPNSCPTGNPPSCNVSLTAKGLSPSSTYQVRLVATTGTQAVTATVPFVTKAAPPTVSGMTANPVTQTTAKLIGFVNPNGEATSYRFEWGADTSYGKQIPAEIEAFAGSGSKAVKVSANLTGLSPNTAYHFRVVAANSAGETVGADQEVLTLNGAALPSNRRYELVSPADKRPQGAVETIAPELLAFQAAADGDSFAYPIIGGLADSTAGGHVEYMARRGPSGWQSTQVSTPSTVSTPISRRVWPSTPKYLSDDLSCAILETHNPASADTPPADVELGVTNLYRWNADGTYTLLTNTVPRNPSSADAAGVFYPVAGASVDCKRVFFKTDYKFLPGASSGLYEWQETGAGGVLRDAGLRPDGSVPPKPYGEGNEVGFGGVVGFDKGGRFDLSQFNSVSPSGRAFFSATSNAGKDSGSLAVFMREPNGTVVDVSQSQTANAALGARYETASPDGSHVFFLGSYGRTAVPGNETMESCTNNTAAAIGKGAACGLYDYDAEAKTLKDLTATTDPANSKGAAVEGVVAVDEDGSHVYFAALGQLLADQGKTYNQNKSSASVNIYLAASGALAYVATIPSGDLARSLGPAGPEVAPGLGANLMRARGAWTAQTTPDGSRLLFTSTGNVSGYESGGAVEAYLYSAGSGATACVSCRTDGAASVASGTAEPIRAALSERQRDFAAPRSLSADGSRVFFEMPDALAPGATEGKRNLYEWRRGVVQWLATLEGDKSLFLGASEDGEDAFIVTQAQLDPHDFDFNRDVYDIKAGGGFPPPEPAPVPCDPAADQCQAPPTLAPGAGTPPSIGASGPGNPPVKQPQKKKHKKKGKQHKKHAHGRAANRNRGGAK
jgi:hypothetical protein